MTKKILITGPESSGKTTLARQLAQYYACPWRPEYAREYLSQLNRTYTITDLTTILREQQKRQAILLAEAPQLLFCDTGPEVLYIWSEVKYGQVAPEITQHLEQQHYDLRLLCYPDLEWEPDPLREAPSPENRLKLWEKYLAIHELRNWDYEVIHEKNNTRLLAAIKIIETQLMA